MINQLSTHCHQWMGALYCLRDYLGPKGLAVAFKSFVRSVYEYDGVAFMGASATHLIECRSWLKDCVIVCFLHFSLVVLLVLLDFSVNF